MATCGPLCRGAGRTVRSACAGHAILDCRWRARGPGTSQPSWGPSRLAICASLISDFTWFHLGKSQGGFILQWLRKRSPEPQSYAGKVQSTYSKYGPRSILVSKFVPLFNILAPQLAGVFRLARWKFFALDSTAAFLWARCVHGSGLDVPQLNWSRSALWSGGWESSSGSRW